MSDWLLALVAIAYIYTAYEYSGNGQFGMSVAFCAYAVANIGFIIASREILR